MLNDRPNFDLLAEQTYYESGQALTPSTADLDRLESDMQLWVPELSTLFKGKRVLDLGAGTAPVGTLIAQRFSPAIVISLELVAHRLRAAMMWHQQLSRLDLTCGNIFTLPFPDGYFDYVVANSVLHHLPHISQAIAEISRVLRPGGFYIGREPNFNNPVVRLAVFTFPNTILFPGSHSANEYPLRAQEIISAFEQTKCDCKMHYFWRRLPILRHPILSVAISVRARRL